MTPDTYRIATPSARLFLALTETLGDPDLLSDLHPIWDVQPGVSVFSLTAQRRARARLADLDPSDLYRRIQALGVPTHDLPELLTTFRLSLTGTFAESRDPGWSVFYEEFSEEHGFLVWSIYSPDPDPEVALERFRQFFFPGVPDSEAFRTVVIVLPGLFSHPGTTPGLARGEDVFPGSVQRAGLPVPES